MWNSRRVPPAASPYWKPWYCKMPRHPNKVSILSLYIDKVQNYNSYFVLVLIWLKLYTKAWNVLFLHVEHSKCLKTTLSCSDKIHIFLIFLIKKFRKFPKSRWLLASKTLTIIKTFTAVFIPTFFTFYILKSANPPWKSLTCNCGSKLYMFIFYYKTT